jgi:hypothetical protein
MSVAVNAANNVAWLMRCVEAVRLKWACWDRSGETDFVKKNALSATEKALE